MLSLLLAVPLVLCQDDSVQVPDPKLVAETVERLEKALKSGEKREKTGALDEAGKVLAPEVVKAIARGFKDSDPEVKQATIQALRWMDHPDALGTLHRTFKTDRAIKKDEELQASLLKAIGQHASVSSIDLLADDVFGTIEYGPIRARLLGLGRIRSKESVEALIGLLKSTNQRTVDRYSGDFRLSLMVLTGTDQGPNSTAWIRWWNEHRKEFEVSAERPKLPRAETMRWTDYWGLEEDHGRTKRREDRGDDPERRRGAGSSGA